MTSEELEERIRECNNRIERLERLRALRLRYGAPTPKETAHDDA